MWEATIPWTGDAGSGQKPVKYKSLSGPESKPVLPVLYFIDFE